MFYDFITKYAVNFVEKMRAAFAMKASHTFSTKKYWRIGDINLEILRLVKDIQCMLIK